MLRIGSTCIITLFIHLILFCFLLLLLPSLDREDAPGLHLEQVRVVPTTGTSVDGVGMVGPNAAAAADISGEKATIAYAISVTSCGGREEGITDGAAVLAYSIRRQKSQGSKYNSKLYAFVHPVAEKCSSPLVDMGYDVQIRETPINATEIKGEFLRRTIQVRGCCQEKELLKLYSYTLSEPVAVHLDVDALILKPLDSLFDAIIDGFESSPLDIKDMELHGNSSLPGQVDAFFTRDYNLSAKGKLAGMQGGFIVVRPSMKVFEEYRRILLEGKHYRGSGWDRKGHGGYYGAQQIQGLVAHYYDFVRPGTAIELNRCVYNAMIDAPRNRQGLCRNGESECEDCRAAKVESIISAHFTICQKPWKCINHRSYPRLCGPLHREWFRARKDLEIESGTFVEHKGEHNPKIFLGYCKSHKRGYTPINVKRQH